MNMAIISIYAALTVAAICVIGLIIMGVHASLDKSNR